MILRVAAAWLALAPALSAAPVPPESVERARQAAAGLGKEIRALLMEELKRGGFPGAISACATRAQRLTADYSRRSGIEVRRVSARARNAQDTPDRYEARMLKSWETARKKGEPLAESAVVATESGVPVLRYMKPILIESMCLNCHGPKAGLHPQVRAEIERAYPKDRATGYRAGDLRGAFSVRLPLPETR